MDCFRNHIEGNKGGMMIAVLELRESKQQWTHPFTRQTATKNVEVQENSEFEELKNGSKLFKVKSVQNTKVLVEYNPLYSMKGYEQPRNKQVWLELNQQKDFCALWENNGVTKSLTLKEVKANSTTQ